MASQKELEGSIPEASSAADAATPKSAAFQLAAERAEKIPDADWTALSAVEGRTGCMTCGCGAHESLANDRWIAVGFGDAHVTKNGKLVWSEGDLPRDDEGLPPGDCPQPLTVGEAEQLAAMAPNADWRIGYFAPLYDAEYQRQGEGHWVLVQSGEGFA